MKPLTTFQIRDDSRAAETIPAAAQSVLETAARIIRPAIRNLTPLVAGLLLAGLSFGASKLAPELRGNSDGLVDVIVQFKTAPSTERLQRLGAHGQIKHIFEHIRAAHVTLPASEVQALENDPSVAYVSPDRKVSAGSYGAVDIIGSTVNAPQAWKHGLDGTGVGVAVIDSGVTTRDDLTGIQNNASRIVYRQSFVAGQGASDLYGHGTHVSGILGGDGEDSNGSGFSQTFKGIAPNVSIINLKVLDQNGSGQTSAVIAAIETAIQLQNTYNIRVINLSLGQPIYESYKLDPLCQAVEQAWAAGIVVVVAAGNYGRDNSQGTNGYATITSPGNDPYAITVGATNMHNTSYRSDDTMASYSSKGPTAIDQIVKPDLVAPGNQVISVLASPACTLFTSYPTTQIPLSTYETGSGPNSWQGGLNQISTTYFRLSGTSMAAPVVSGAAALLIQNQPSLTPDQVKARLMKTASKNFPLYSTATDSVTSAVYNIQSDIFTVGAGYLDIAAALANNDLATMPALSPVVTYNAATGVVTLVDGLSVVWGSSVVWGDSVVWGSAVFSGTASGMSVVWGSSVVWGDSMLAGFSVVWGDNINLGAMQAANPGDGDN